MPEEQLQSQQAVGELERPVRTVENSGKPGKLENPVGQSEDTENGTQEAEKKVRRPARKVSTPPPDARSYKSFWPFALAILLSIALMGVVTNPILFFVGMVLCVVVVIAWGVERR